MLLPYLIKNKESDHMSGIKYIYIYIIILLDRPLSKIIAIIIIAFKDSMTPAGYCLSNYRYHFDVKKGIIFNPFFFYNLFIILIKII